MSGRATVDRMVPSVEEAQCWLDYLLCSPCGHPFDENDPHETETAVLALDMALAQESDARRAEAARLRAEVAW